MSPIILSVLGLVLLFIVWGTWKNPRLASVIIWALIATIFLTSVLLMHVPGSFSEKALWFTLAVPLIWTGLQFWCYWDGRPWRVTFGLIGISLISAVIVFTTTPSGLSQPISKTIEESSS